MEIKCPCQKCGQSLSFPANMSGDWVACPHCALQTQLLNPNRLSSQSLHAVHKSKDPGWVVMTIGMLGLGVAYVALVDARFIEMFRLIGHPDSGATPKAHVTASIIESLAVLATGITVGLFVWFSASRLSKREVSFQFVTLLTTLAVLLCAVLRKNHDVAEAAMKRKQYEAGQKQRELEAKSGLEFRDLKIKSAGFAQSNLEGIVANKSQQSVWAIEVRLRFRHKTTGLELDTWRTRILTIIEPGETKQFQKEVFPPRQEFEWSFEVVGCEVQP